MQEYRAYALGSDGHFIGFEPIVCANDDEATEQAKRLLDGHDIELWNGARMVIRLNAKNTEAVSHEIKDGVPDTQEIKPPQLI
jgi:hypothetical protein